MLVPKVLVGTLKGLTFSVIALTSMMKGKRRLGQHLELGDRGAQDHFPDQQYNNGTRGSQSQPKAKVKESQEKEARAKVEKAKGLGPKLVCGIHILDARHTSGTHSVRLEPPPELGSFQHQTKVSQN